MNIVRAIVNEILLLIQIATYYVLTGVIIFIAVSAVAALVPDNMDLIDSLLAAFGVIIVAVLGRGIFSGS